MGRARLQKTLADYMAIAFSPALIMALVGSLVFFLVEIGYEGPHESRLKWILFWFVFAAVLVSRIAIEQGRSYAAVYAGGLGIATFLVVLQFVQAVWLPVGLLILVWWCVDKLTWDCTLIDDAQDASGQGLMQVVGLDDDVEPAAAAGKERPYANNSLERITDWWNSWNRVGQNPGIWVVYFSFAALPLFGLGQLAIPREDTASRDQAFQYLLVYVTSAAGLLLTTSFLGLRRYLRQRRIQMPATVARSWFLTGLLMLAGILVVATLIPRPSANYSITALVDRVTGKDRESSEYAMLDDDAAQRGDDQSGQVEPGQQDQPGQGQDGQGQQNQGQQRPGQGQNGQQGQGQNGQGQGQGQQGQGQQGQGQQGQGKGQGQQGEGEQGQQGRQGQGQQGDGQSQDGTQNQSPSGDPSVMDDVADGIASLFKWIVYALIGCLLLYLILTNWQRIVGSILAFVAAVRAFFARLFGIRLPGGSQDVRESVPGIAPVPFRAFSDPFATGRARQMSGLELMQYTYQALVAWSDEFGTGRSPELTPEEFAESIRARTSVLEPALAAFVRLHTGIVFGPEKRLKKSQFPVIEGLWNQMTSNQPTRPQPES